MLKLKKIFRLEQFSKYEILAKNNLKPLNLKLVLEPNTLIKIHKNYRTVLLIYFTIKLMKIIK